MEAVLFDLDGVVTKTAVAHAAAWKHLFDDYLRARAARTGAAFEPFDPHADYREFLDGMPRYDGVRRFLESRGIRLTPGDPGDAPERETVCGLGNRKNGYFHAWLESNRVEAFPSTVALIGRLRAAGLKIAVFSASRNAKAVLANAGVAALFDVRVDGNDLAALGIPGKPDPAMILEAAARLGVAPERSAVVEDAIAGVRAGAAGGFKTVIGIDRDDYGAELAAHGADIVVHDLAELAFDEAAGFSVRTQRALPPVWDRLTELEARLAGRIPAVFLDYDGTLTPIVEDFTKAFLSETMRAAIDRLAGRCAVTIVSGRDVAVLKGFVGLDSVIYAGSHGFEVDAPLPLTGRIDVGEAFLPDLDAAERELREGLRGIEFHAVERKRFAIAVHYRRVRDADVSAVERVVDRVVGAHGRLRKGHGKKVFRIQPRIDWDKGRAVLWIFEHLDLPRAGALPIYLGDDLTDEDAFRALAGQGVSIAVGEEDRPTAADYRVATTADVERLLGLLSEFVEGDG